MTMDWKLEINDTSLFLLMGIISLLLLRSLQARWNQPTLHPLILARQSDLSQVHQRRESPTYRNANSPHGFELAARPRRGVETIEALLLRGVGARGGGGEEEEEEGVRRCVYGVDVTNGEIVADAKRFGNGLLKIIDGDGGRNEQMVRTLAISVEVDHLESLQAVLAGQLLRDSSSGKTSFSTLVIPPLILSQEGQPETLPSDGQSSRLAAVYTTSKAIGKVVDLPMVTSDTLFILKDEQEVDEAQKALQANGGRLPYMKTFKEVLEQGSAVDSSANQSAAQPSQGNAVACSFWLGSAWTQVTNRALCAGVTAYLSFYPADKIPSTSDRILVEQSPLVQSPSHTLGAAATPAGLALALTALFTGAGLQASLLTSSLDDPNPDCTPSLAKFKPTIIYASPNGASSLGLALTSRSKRSPLSAWVYKQKLASLRGGVLRRDSLWDTLLFNSTRKATGTDQVRSVTIVGSGWVVGQGLLDILRGHLGCAVMNAFLPSSCPLKRIPPSSDGSKETSHGVWLTAPICSSHAYDLQAFQANDGISEMPAHVGPPSVSVELKLVDVQERDDEAEEEVVEVPHGWQRFLSSDGARIGEVVVRGAILTSGCPSPSQEEEEGEGEVHPSPPPPGRPTRTPLNHSSTAWYSTSQMGAFRSNGTLLLLPTSRHAEEGEMVPVPTLSATYPIKGKGRIGSGRSVEQEVREGKVKGE